MAQETIEKKKGHKGLKIFGIIVGIIVAIVLAGVVVINIMVKPVDDQSDKAVPVGGMLSSSTISYVDEETGGCQNNLVLKIMQIVWKSCDASDRAAHEKQTPPEVVMKKDIPYMNDNNPYHMLDVYYPQGKIIKEGLPVIIDIHGGGWMYATKDLNEYYCRELASKGYVVFSISYRLVPDVTVNEQIKDSMEALAWISKNLGKYPANPNTICITGDSAGGQLASYCTILSQSPDAREIFGTVDPKISFKCTILTSPVAYMKNGGAFSIYTKMLWGKDYKTKATYNYMDISEMIQFVDEMPPTYFITSSGDTLAHDQTVTMYNLYQENGFICEIQDFGEVDGEKLPHVFSVLDPFGKGGQKAINDALEFYQQALLR